MLLIGVPAVIGSCLNLSRFYSCCDLRDLLAFSELSLKKVLTCFLSKARMRRFPTVLNTIYLVLLPFLLYFIVLQFYFSVFSLIRNLSKRFVILLF